MNNIMIRKTITLLLFSFAFLNCSSQKAVVAVKPVDHSKNNYIDIISRESLKQNLEIIASDGMEGRETGSEGQKKAGRYTLSTEMIPSNPSSHGFERIVIEK